MCVPTLFSFFLIAFLFFDFPKHTRQRRAIRGRSAQSRGSATQRTAGAWGMASSREMVAALGLEEKKTRIEHKVTNNN